MKIFNITAAALFTLSMIAAEQTAVVDFATLAGENPVQAFEKLIASPKPVVIKFHKKGCPPCISSEPEYQKMALALKDKAVFISLSTDTFSSIANQLKIRSVPTWMVFANKGKLAHITGSNNLPKVAQAITDYATTAK